MIRRNEEHHRNWLKNMEVTKIRLEKEKTLEDLFTHKLKN